MLSTLSNVHYLLFDIIKVGNTRSNALLFGDICCDNITHPKPLKNTKDP